MTPELKAIMRNKKRSIIVSNSESLYAEVIELTKNLLEGTSITERLYWLDHEPIDQICQYGNRKKFIDGSVGYRFCGRETTCPCNKEQKSKKISLSKQRMSQDEKEKVQRVRQKTCLERYSVDHISKLDMVKKKKEQTCREKYGEKTNLLTEENKIKRQSTSMMRYGTQHPMMNSQVSNKSLKTRLEKYGRCSVFGSDDFSKIMQEKYLVDHALQNSNLLSKCQSTNMEKYGNKVYTRSEDFKKKSRTTYLNNGYRHPKHPYLLEDGYDLFDDKEFFSQEFASRGFKGLEEYYGIKPPAIRSLLKKYQIDYQRTFSYPEQLIYDILVDSGLKKDDIIINSRSIIKPYEIDFFIPSINLGIEYNGLYWHCELSNGKTRMYHKTKSIMANSMGIELLFITTELYDNYQAVKKSIQSRIIKNSKSYGARELTVKPIEYHDAKEFVESNHVKGILPATYHIGGFIGEELVCYMSFRNSRPGIGKNSMELIRSCASLPIAGWQNKILKFFSKIYSGELTSYADLSWGSGNIYERLGFTKMNNGTPNYHYTKDYKTLENRFNFTKSKLVDKGHDVSKSEWVIMKELGYDRYWDCGSAKYVKII